MRLISKIIGNQEKPVSNSGENVALTSNPNLLINPWFTVNQRGQNSYTVNYKYTVDRWQVANNIAIDSVVQPSSSGLTINIGTNTLVSLYQHIENALPDGDYTLSVLISGVVYSVKIALSSTFVTGNVTTGIIYQCSNSSIGIQTDHNVTIRAIKLELGSTSTLHLDTAPDYTTELLKCQRYFYKLTANITNGDMFIGVCSNTTTIRAFIQFPTTMRISPTITTSGSFSIVTASESQTPSSVTGTAAQTTQQVGHIAVVGTGLTAGQMVFIRSAAIGDSVNFDAEL